MAGVSDNPYDPAGPILSKETGRRLDAIVRRFGGKPKSTESVKGRVILPSVGRRSCKGQLALGEDDDSPPDEAS